MVDIKVGQEVFILDRQTKETISRKITAKEGSAIKVGRFHQSVPMSQFDTEKSYHGKFYFTSIDNLSDFRKFYLQASEYYDLIDDILVPLAYTTVQKRKGVLPPAVQYAAHKVYDLIIVMLEVLGIRPNYLTAEMVEQIKRHELEPLPEMI